MKDKVNKDFEILIRVAISNGWDMWQLRKYFQGGAWGVFKHRSYPDEYELVTQYNKSNEYHFASMSQLIFNSDFLEALFRRETPREVEKHLYPALNFATVPDLHTVDILVNTERVPAWKYHQHQLLDETAPIKYLMENVKYRPPQTN